MAGFYKNDNGNLIEALSMVTAPTFTLDIAKKDEYSFPVGDWYCFDSREQALAAFGITELTQEEREEKIKAEAEAARLAAVKEFSSVK